MLHVGHFTFIGPEPGPGHKAEAPHTGWFTLLVEAESAEAAVEKF
jgi:hypothetical protein